MRSVAVSTTQMRLRPRSATHKYLPCLVNAAPCESAPMTSSLNTNFGVWPLEGLSGEKLSLGPWLIHQGQIVTFFGTTKGADSPSPATAIVGSCDSSPKVRPSHLERNNPSRCGRRTHEITSDTGDARPFVVGLFAPASARAQGSWETTPESEAAPRRGLEWLAKNQGAEGNWEEKHLGLVSMGALAYMSAGHTRAAASMEKTWSGH